MARPDDTILTSAEFYTDLPVGEILRRARLQTGMSVADVGKFLRIRASHLEALEQSNFDALPGRVYVIGFVRTYAEFLNLDGARVVELLKRQSRGLTTPQEMNAFVPVQESRLPSVSILTVAVAALMIMVVIWIGFRNDRMRTASSLPPAPSEMADMSALEKLAAPSTSTDITVPEAEDTIAPGTPGTEGMGPPAPAATPATPAVPVAPPIEIYIREDSWVELRNPEGRVVEARLFRAGEEFGITKPVDEFGNAFVITTGNAAGVVIRVNGRDLPPLGKTNQVRRNIALKPDTLGKLLPN